MSLFCNRYNIKEYSLRNRLLNEIGFNTYSDYLKSDLWKKNRENFLKCNRLRRHLYRNGDTCEFCKKPGIMNVHHMRYFTIGKERHQDLYYLCRECHESIHMDRFRIKTNTRRRQRKMKKI